MVVCHRVAQESALVLGAVVAATTLLLTSLPLAGQSTAPCGVGGWTEPRPVFGNSVWLPGASFVFPGEQTLVVGNALRGPDRSVRNALRIVPLGKDTMGVPAGVPDGEFFLHPLATLDSAGALHLFWGEPLTPDPSDGHESDARAARIFHSAEFTEGDYTIDGQSVNWSVPQVGYQAERVAWEGQRSAAAGVAPDGAIHMAFPTFGSGRLVHVRYDPPEVLQTTSFRDSGFYPGLAWLPNGDLVMSFIAPDRSASSDANSVFVRRSGDWGRTWDEPVLVSRSGRREAHGLKMAVDGRGRIHLLWRKNLTGGRVTQAIWHSLSDDGGRTWSPPVELPVPGAEGTRRTTELAVAPTAAGDVHAFYGLLVDGQTRFHHREWSEDAGWSEPCLFDGGNPAFELAAASDGGGSLHVIWNRVLAGSLLDAEFDATAMYSRLDP